MRTSQRTDIRVAVAVIIMVIAAMAGFELSGTAPEYRESATLMFSLPKSESAPNAYLAYARSLITSGEAITQMLASPPAQQRLRSAGRPARVSMELVNLYSQQYPDYGEPLATLSATSPSAATAHRAFTAAARLVAQLLASRQAQVPRRDRITARIIADSGPLAQDGSRARVLGGLAILALALISGAWGLADRLWPGEFSAPRRRLARGAAE